MMASRIGVHRIRGTSMTAHRLLPALIALGTGWFVAADAAFAMTQPPRPAKPAATQPAKVAPKPTIAVGGVGVQAAWPKSVNSSFWNRSRTWVQLRVRFAPGGMTRIDRKASTVVAFTDNQGTNLATHPVEWGMMNLMMQTDRDNSWKRQAVAVNVSTEALPAAGTTQLHLKGTLAVDIAKEAKTYTWKNVAMRAGTTFKAGPLSLIIKRVNATNVRFAAVAPDGNLIRIAKAQFLDAAGQTIKARRSGSSSTGGRRTEVAYHLDQQAKAVVTMKLTVWQGIKQVTVPFDVVASLGLKPLKVNVN